MKLTIITINKNNCAGLRKTMESVVNQTWEEFEWIIVDGGSTDGSKELIEDAVQQLASQGWSTDHFSLLGFTAEDWKNGKFTIPSKKYSTSLNYPHIPSTVEVSTCINSSQLPSPQLPSNKITVPHLKWTSEKDNGIYNAMNKGIMMAKGEYCLFLNSGDCLYEISVLENISKYFDGTNIISGYIYSNKGKRLTAKRFPIENFSASDMFITIIHHQSSFIKRNLLLNYYGYKEDYQIAADWFFFLEALIKENATLQTVPIPISIYDETGISAQYSNKTESEKEHIINEIFPYRVYSDIRNSLSLKSVRANRMTRIMYAVLYRLSCFMKNNMN